MTMAEDGNGGGAAAYLKMGIGARPLALGGAYTALAEGAATTYYNPAGLGMIEQKEIDTMHAVLSLDRKLDYFSYAHPLKGTKIGGTLSFGWIRFGVDDIPETRVDALGNPVLDAAGNVRVFSYFEDVENAMTIGYGKQWNEKVHLGAALNRYTHKLFNNSADGYGLDLGVLYKANKKANVGLTVRHIGAELKWDTATARKDDIPLATVLGTTYQVRENIKLLLDLEKNGDEDLRPHFGVEGWVNNKIALRGGLDKDNISAGVGYRTAEWNFDYAFADQELGDVHRVSASLRF
jgi:hypothetical protein